MTVFSRLCCVPRRLDAHQKHLVSDKTLRLYETALNNFVDWLLREKFNPGTSDEVDCLLVQYKNTCMLPKHKLIYTIAALEFFVPQLKKHLPWAHRVASGYQISHATVHTVPCTGPVCRLYGCAISSTGKPSLGFGFILQQVLGLRPSELLKLRKAHVLDPSFGCGVYIFRLGARTGTKSKREQAAKLDPKLHPEVAAILKQLLSILQPDDFLVPYSYQTFLDAINGVSQNYDIQEHVTPHGARAGFATERIAAGEDPTAVRLAGRWDSESSFKTYIDVIMASQVSIMLALSGHKQVIEYTYLHLHLYFSEQLFARERHAARRSHKVPSHRPVLASDADLPRRHQTGKEQQTQIRNARISTESAGAGIGGKPAAGLRSGSSTAGPGKGQGKGLGLGSSLLRIPRKGKEEVRGTKTRQAAR